jgi:hypothetical protein
MESNVASEGTDIDENKTAIVPRTVLNNAQNEFFSSSMESLGSGLRRILV